MKIYLRLCIFLKFKNFIVLSKVAIFVSRLVVNCVFSKTMGAHPPLDQ